MFTDAAAASRNDRMTASAWRRSAVIWATENDFFRRAGL